MRFQRFNPQRSITLTLALLASLVGCSVPVKPTIISASTTQPPATSTPMPSPVPPTRTPLPTYTPEPPTPTAAPTLTADEEQALALNLLQTNAGCRLPCWWGFTPGMTDWQTAQTFFASVGKTSVKYSDARITNYTVKFSVPQHDGQIGQVYNVKDGVIDMIWVSGGTVRNRERVYGDVQFTEDWRRYMLPELLDDYGQPTAVLLRTFYSVPEGSFIPFNLLLFYPQQGILARYYGPTERVGERIRICPQQADITLWLWSPEQEMSLEDIARWGQQFPIEEVPDFRSLEEATGWSIEQFYQTFVQSGDQPCFETPADMWRRRAPD